MSGDEKLAKIFYGQLKIIGSEVRALVSILSKEQQSEWLLKHKQNCERMGIDPMTGLSAKLQSSDDDGTNADIS